MDTEKAVFGGNDLVSAFTTITTKAEDKAAHAESSSLGQCLRMVGADGLEIATPQSTAPSSPLSADNTRSGNNDNDNRNNNSINENNSSNNSNNNSDNNSVEGMRSASRLVGSPQALSPIASSLPF
jgi:hypothetical protein